jgi:uncharacterized protein
MNRSHYVSYICNMNLIEENRKQLFDLCVMHKVKELYLFGSILTNNFNEFSDIDMLIQFYQVDLMEYFDNYMDFKEKLEELLHRPIDLVENQSIKNPIFRNVVDRQKQLIYERNGS